jgi:hypothetical protein
MNNLFDLDSSFIGKTTMSSKSSSHYVAGLTLLNADLPSLVPRVSLRHLGHQAAEPIDLEAITLEALFELTEHQVDLFSPEPVESDCFEPIPFRSHYESQEPAFPRNPLKRQQVIGAPIASIHHPTKKIKRVALEPSTSDKVERFREYQSQQWTTMFEELCAFIKKTGHCQVPHSYPENESLARWTKRQRYQYKLKQEGKPSTMSDDRIGALNALGFVWDSHSAVWEERWQELREYCRVNGHCLVPSQHDENQKLATWVKCQRRQYKLNLAGERSNITMERVTKLENLGFTWELRSHAK